jgi:hypothetical protein
MVADSVFRLRRPADLGMAARKGRRLMGEPDVNYRRHEELEPDNTQPEGRDPGQYIGGTTGAEMGSDSVPGGVQSRDDRIGGNATQDAGPAARGANLQPGWSEPPEGHRQAERDVEVTIRRKG